MLGLIEVSSCCCSDDCFLLLAQDAKISKDEYQVYWVLKKNELSDMDFDNLLSQAEALAKGAGLMHDGWK